MRSFMKAALGLALAFTAGSALAGEYRGYDGPRYADQGGYVEAYGDRYGPPPADYGYPAGPAYDDGYGYDHGGYGHAYAPPPPMIIAPPRHPCCQAAYVPPPPCGSPCGGYHRGYSLPTYGDAAQHYGYPTCGCGGEIGGRGGQVSIRDAWFYDGGVGPIPDGGYYGGGGGYVYGGGYAGSRSSASASASAYSSSSTSIRIGGGWKGGYGGKGGHGGKGGCSGCGGGKH